MDRGVPVLHIVGCGRAARVVARRLLAAGQVRIGQIVNRGLSSAQRAAKFIGRGTPAVELAGCSDSDWLLLGLPDGAVGQVAAALSHHGRQPPRLVFHLSGGLAADALAAFECPAASVHPLRAFADPDLAVDAFCGTWCTLEGSETALALLEPALQAAGARTARLSTSDKRLYHAATVAASNFLVTLNALAGELAVRAGLDPAQANEMLCDLQSGTVENIRALAAARALTGPIERGDLAACRALLAAVPGEFQPLFRVLGAATVELAAKRHSGRDWGELRVLFSG